MRLRIPPTLILRFDTSRNKNTAHGDRHSSIMHDDFFLSTHRSARNCSCVPNANNFILRGANPCHEG